MSSYQFVNSLSSCYGQRPGQDSSAHGQDYYGGSQYSTGCYNPVSQSAHQYPYTPSSVHQQHQHPALQNGDHYSAVAGSGRLAGAGNQSAGSASSHSPRAHTPTHPCHVSSPQPSSCKYASTDTNSAGSPQDLSTTNNQHHGSADSPEPRSNSPQNTQDSKSVSHNPPQIYPWMRKVHIGQSK